MSYENAKAVLAAKLASRQTGLHYDCSNVDIAIVDQDVVKDICSKGCHVDSQEYLEFSAKVGGLWFSWKYASDDPLGEFIEELLEVSNES